ncbi:hypothetical protein E5D57_006013 [Metarhizium anisopliae]|nr:hypothetical protein E5D57_006013 [Metarhizium anisopliae]
MMSNGRTSYASQMMDGRIPPERAMVMAMAVAVSRSPRNDRLVYLGIRQTVGMRRWPTTTPICRLPLWRQWCEPEVREDLDVSTCRSLSALWLSDPKRFLGKANEGSSGKSKKTTAASSKRAWLYGAG